ncbi:MAG: YggW family oxidoreductase, partial [Gammaproteobacteria bacterium]|nr:YggW family oxidoreductase [Gammaproteobacteria bacterium]
MKTPPLSLYIHLPWCVRKCPYCDFNSHRQPADQSYSNYIDALLADLRFESASVEGRALVSIFI